MTLRQFKIIATIFVLALTSVTSAAFGEQAEKLHINVGMQPIVNGPLYIAMEKGYFEQLGLEVNVIQFTSGPAQFAALAGGQIDLAWGGLGTFLVAKANGTGLSFISVLMDYNALEALVVPANSQITSIQGLAGKKIGLVRGSDGHYGLIKTLQAHGMDAGSVEILSMAPNVQISAMKAGDIDAAYLWQPFLEPLYENGARTLAKLSDLNPGSAFLGWAGKREWLENHQDSVNKLLKGWDMGLTKMKKNPELAIQYSVELTGMSEAQARAIAKDLGYFKSTAALNPDSPAYWTKGSALNEIMHDFFKFAQELGLVSDNANVNVDNLVATDFMESLTATE